MSVYDTMVTTFLKKGLIYWSKTQQLISYTPKTIYLRYLCESRQTEKIKISKSECNIDEKISKDKEPEIPEEPTTCCMSGCANCVWLDYAEKMSDYFKDGGERAVEEINERVNDPNIKAFLLQELRMRNL